jgi:hypothetical protein
VTADKQLPRRWTRLAIAQSYNPAITAADLGAFYRGWDAFNVGLSTSKNPYPPGTADRAAWACGFEAGSECEEQDRKEY